MKDNEITIGDLKKQVDAFVDERDWKQFHSPKNLAMALSVEVAELSEIFQWLSEEQSKKENISDEDLAKALGMTEDELFSLAEDVGIDQYGGLTKDNYEDVMQHIIDNFEDYKQTHILK